MNGRAPEYRKCNEVTLIHPETRKFYTFWKNVHQQFFVTEGQINGFTYTVGEDKLVDKDEGNNFYLECRKAGYIKWDEYRKNKPIYSDYPKILF